MNCHPLRRTYAVAIDIPARWTARIGSRRNFRSPFTGGGFRGGGRDEEHRTLYADALSLNGLYVNPLYVTPLYVGGLPVNPLYVGGLPVNAWYVNGWYVGDARIALADPRGRRSVHAAGLGL